MLGGCSPREEFFADQALAHALADDNEHLTDLVRTPLCFFVSSHESRNYKFVTSVPRMNSTAQPQQNQQC